MMADHRTKYKNTGLDAKELRRRREEGSVQLRKQKRDDVLSKKRMIKTNIEDLEDNNDSNTTIHDDADYSTYSSESAHDLTLTPEIIAGIHSNDDAVILDCAQKIRKILSKEPQPPFDEVIKTGMIPRLLQLLQYDKDTNIQFEVAWVLTNICSGTTEQTHTVVDHGALPPLIRLLGSTEFRVVEQAVWALGNIIGDGPDLRDRVISYGFVPVLVSLIGPQSDISFLRNATWVLVNLCRCKEPPASITVVQQLLPTLANLIELGDQNILIDGTWAISYISDLGADYSQLIIDSNILVKMTPLLNHPEPKIQIAAIRALGGVATGNDEQTQVVVDAGVLPHLAAVFKEKGKDRVVKEALWLMSNILAGTPSQIQAVVDFNLLHEVVHYLSVGDFQQQKEATWGIYNLCCTGTNEQLRALIEADVIPPLCDLLGLKEVSMIRNVLESLNHLLRVGKENPEGLNFSVRDVIESCGGLDKIESLQDNSNHEIYQHAFNIIENYFGSDEN